MKTQLIKAILPLLFCVSTAYADDLSLLINGKSIHLDQQPGVTYNERNYGLGVQYDLTKGNEKWVPFLMASGFKDSNSNMSYCAGGGIVRRFNVPQTSIHVDAGMVTFLMTRKDYNEGNAFLGALPVLSVGTDRVSVNMTYIPKVDPKMVPVLFFQLKIKIDSF